MKTKLNCLIIILLFAFLSACGSPPLVAPEQDVDQEVTSSAQSEQLQTDSRATRVAQSTATLAIVGGSNTSPLMPSPTAFSPSTTPPILSPSPTSTFVPMPDEPIMGYIFETPEEISSTRQIEGVEIVDWLPNSSKQVLLRGVFELGVLDITTGETTIYTTVEEPGNLNQQPVWLNEAEGIAYHSWDFETNEGNIWLQKKDVERSLLVPDALPILIPIQQTKSIVTFSQNDQSVQSISSTGQQLRTSLPPAFESLPRPEFGPPGSTPRIAARSSTTWLAYYNNQGFFLTNPQTGETKTVPLTADDGTALWALNARWSPDGQKLALILTQGTPPVLFSNLYILEWPSGNIYKLDDKFQYIEEIAWAPNSNHLLLQPVIGQKEGFNLLALHILDIMTSDILPIPVPTDNMATSAVGGGLSWSPDGNVVLLKYGDESGSVLYQMKVSA